MHQPGDSDHDGRWTPTGRGHCTNAGNLTIGGTLNVNSGTIENQGQMTVNGQVSLNGAILNSGRLDIQGNLGVNSGGDVDNACTITVSGSTTLDAPGISNSGQWLIGGNLLLNGSAALALDGVITANTLNNLDGDITGSGAMRIEGSSLQNGSSAVTGTPEINIYDVTQTNPPAFFDTQNGTVTNAVRVAFDVPDPNVPPAGCSGATDRAEADMSVTKTGPATAFVGQPVTYTITVANDGPDTAEGVLLHEFHDPTFTITDVTGHLVRTVGLPGRRRPLRRCLGCVRCDRLLHADRDLCRQCGRIVGDRRSLSWPTTMPN